MLIVHAHCLLPHAASLPARQELQAAAVDASVGEAAVALPPRLQCTWCLGLGKAFQHKSEARLVCNLSPWRGEAALTGLLAVPSGGCLSNHSPFSYYTNVCKISYAAKSFVSTYTAVDNHHSILSAQQQNRVKQYSSISQACLHVSLLQLTALLQLLIDFAPHHTTT